MFRKDSAVLYYLFHFIYSGQPSHTLERLWLAYETDRDLEANDGSVRSDVGRGADRLPSFAWKAFDDALKESYRATGVMAGLIAAAAAALLTTPFASAHSATPVLLIASLTCSLIGASSAASLLTVASYSNPHVLEHNWRMHGVKFVILLSTPSAWLSHALRIFQAALLALVWISDFTGARIVVSILVATSFIIGIALEISFVGLKETLAGFFGLRKSISHRVLVPTQVKPHYLISNILTAAIEIRKKYHASTAPIDTVDEIYKLQSQQMMASNGVDNISTDPRTPAIPASDIGRAYGRAMATELWHLKRPTRSSSKDSTRPAEVPNDDCHLDSPGHDMHIPEVTLGHKEDEGGPE